MFPAGSVLYTIPAPLVTPPAGALGHARATVTVGDQLLSTALASGLPKGTASPFQWAAAVTMQVEAADAANLVFVAGIDGTLTPASATWGLQVPIAPASIRIPFPDGLKTSAGTLRVCAVTGTAHVQCFFEYSHQ